MEVDMQKRSGTIPKDANGIIGVGDETGWTIYRRATSAAPWINLKLVHAEPIEGAANYWLGWHAQEKRLAQTADIARIARGNPDLLEWVKEVMAELYPTLSEDDMKM